MIRKIIDILVLSFLMMVLSLPSVAKTLTFGCLSPPGYEDYDYAVSVVKEAFQRMGYDIEVRTLPSQQIVDMLRNGQLDGDCTRIYKLIN